MDIGGRGDLFFLVFTYFLAENGDPIVNRGPRFFFFLSTTLNLTYHLKKFAIPDIAHRIVNKAHRNEKLVHACVI